MIACSLNRLKNEAETLKGAQAELEEKLRFQTAELIKKSKALDSKQAEVIKINAEKADMEAQLSKGEVSQQEVKALTAKVEALAREKAEVTSQISSLARDNDALTSKCRALEDQLNSDKYFSLLAKCEEVTQESAEAAEIQKKLGQIETERKILATAKSDVEQKLEVARAEALKFREEASQERRNNASLQSRNLNLSGAIEELESKVSGLKYDSLMNQITRMNDGELESLAEKTKAVRRYLKYPHLNAYCASFSRLNVTMTG